MLDKKMLEDMPPGTIFAIGTVLNPGLYNKPVKWLAKRGGIDDWAIYYHLAESSVEYIKDYGDKCFTKKIIRELVPCDDESFKRYRY